MILSPTEVGYHFERENIFPFPRTTPPRAANYTPPKIPKMHAFALNMQFLAFGHHLAMSQGKDTHGHRPQSQQHQKRGPYVRSIRRTCYLSRRHLRHHAPRPLCDTADRRLDLSLLCSPDFLSPGFSVRPGTPCQSQPNRDGHGVSHLNSLYPTNFNRPHSTTECRATASRCGKSTRK